MIYFQVVYGSVRKASHELHSGNGVENLCPRIKDGRELMVAEVGHLESAPSATTPSLWRQLSLAAVQDGEGARLEKRATRRLDPPQYHNRYHQNATQRARYKPAIKSKKSKERAGARASDEVRQKQTSRAGSVVVARTRRTKSKASIGNPAASEEDSYSETGTSSGCSTSTALIPGSSCDPPSRDVARGLLAGATHPLEHPNIPRDG
ncbi:hypothetical protein L917_19918 [Phytophthora nicotianae]|uniref:Uncharacterized protein n=1 Tax=Phytophthora nicotianae TaxID=4792 RepID=W2K2V1_PHYNI|nr:hypothetical protein L917_19918 [Phytophthora nicotianae]